MWLATCRKLFTLFLHCKWLTNVKILHLLFWYCMRLVTCKILPLVLLLCIPHLRYTSAVLKMDCAETLPSPASAFHMVFGFTTHYDYLNIQYKRPAQYIMLLLMFFYGCSSYLEECCCCCYYIGCSSYLCSFYIRFTINFSVLTL